MLGNNSKFKKDIKQLESCVFIFDFKHVFVWLDYLFAYSLQTVLFQEMLKNVFL